MTRHLCITVHFLDPLYHGQGDGGKREWPPSPLRLFQALLAGARTGCRNREWSDAKAKAFRWLEQRKPPVIVAPKAPPAPSYTLYVPNNDSDKKFDRQERLTSKIARPSRLGNGTAVHYLWLIENGEWSEVKPHTDLLCSVARHLFALGWGIDLAVADGQLLNTAQVATLAGQRWNPWDGYHSPGVLRHRVPIDGTLEDLLHVHESFLRSVDRKQYRPPQDLQAFTKVTYLPSGILLPRPHATFELRSAQDNWWPFRQTEAIVVAAMIRHLTCNAAKSDKYKFPGGSERYVAGHIDKSGAETNTRFSYLPLPTIGHRHADGMIRRVIITEPFGGESEYAAWAGHRLRNAELAPEKRGSDSQIGTERRAALSDPLFAILVEAQDEDTVFPAYVRSSLNWSSVTPVVLSGLDDCKQSKAERLFFKAMRQAGLPVEAVQDLTLRKAPFWSGSQHPRHYRRPQYLKHLPAWHACIRFRELISGPLAIGAGRHCGLGVFAGRG